MKLLQIKNVCNILIDLFYLESEVIKNNKIKRKKYISSVSENETIGGAVNLEIVLIWGACIYAGWITIEIVLIRNEINEIKKLKKNCCKGLDFFE
jgi:hypothetical protein